MHPKVQSTVDFVKKHRWQSAVLVGGSIAFLASPLVQCPIIFIRAYNMQQKMKDADMLSGFSMIGEALGLRNEALGKSCQKFTWMIPNKEARETMEYALKPMEFPNFSF